LATREGGWEIRTIDLRSMLVKASNIFKRIGLFEPKCKAQNTSAHPIKVKHAFLKYNIK